MAILAGDIGGTKCLFALYEGNAAVAEQRYESKNFAEFHEVVQTFLDSTGVHPDCACFAIAGPVAEGRCKTTNLPWIIDQNDLSRILKVDPVLLVNDFHAQAAAVLKFTTDDYVEIHGAPVKDGAPIAILGAGTGLGEAFLFAGDGHYEVVASEGGHCEFAPMNELQLGLLRWLWNQFGGHASYERVLSGRGMINIYEFLRDSGQTPESADVRKEMANEDPAAVITRHGLARTDVLCDRAIDVFCEIYGQEAGNQALKVMAFGGVYACGGIAPRILERLQDGKFEAAYLNKGRLRAVVDKIPCRIVTNAKSGLLGAAAVAARLHARTKASVV